MNPIVGTNNNNNWSVIDACHNAYKYAKITNIMMCSLFLLSICLDVRELRMRRNNPDHEFSRPLFRGDCEAPYLKNHSFCEFPNFEYGTGILMRIEAVIEGIIILAWVGFVRGLLKI